METEKKRNIKEASSLDVYVKIREYFSKGPPLGRREQSCECIYKSNAFVFSFHFLPSENAVSTLPPTFTKNVFDERTPRTTTTATRGNTNAAAERKRREDDDDFDDDDLSKTTTTTKRRERDKRWQNHHRTPTPTTAKVAVVGGGER